MRNIIWTAYLCFSNNRRSHTPCFRRNGLCGFGCSRRCFLSFFRCLVCLLILAFLPEFLQDSPFCLLCVFCRLSRCFSTGFLCCLMQKTACSFLKELGFLQTGISLMHSTACPVHRIPEGASRNGPACGTFSFSAYLLRCLLFFPRRSPPFFWSTAGASIS